MPQESRSDVPPLKHAKKRVTEDTVWVVLGTGGAADLFSARTYEFHIHSLNIQRKPVVIQNTSLQTHLEHRTK